MVDTGSSSPNARSSEPAAASRRRPRRSAARRTRGILDARVKKLSANQCAIGRALGRARCSHDCTCHSLGSRLRAELMSLATGPLGEPIALTLDKFTFQPADASQVALFFNTFGSLYHIRKFSLGKDAVVKLDTPEQIRPYIIAIENLPFLEEISFNGASIGIWAAYPLAVALRSKKRLRRADFSNCFASRGQTEIAPAMDALVSACLELPDLESINLEDNAFGPEVEWPFLRLVRSHTPLRELNINNMGIGPETGVNLAKALVELSRNKASAPGGAAPPLQALLSNRNRYAQDDDTPLFGMAEWAAAFAAHPGLRTLHFGTNGVRREGMDLLVSEGLARLRAIEDLDLNDNIFTSRGSEHSALAAAVPGWPALRSLNLNDSLLGSRGAALLIAALAAGGGGGGGRLETLRMTGCNLHGGTTLALAAALGRGALPELRELELGTNNFPGDDPGFAALGRALEERRRERGLDTSIDEVDEDPTSQPSV